MVDPLQKPDPEGTYSPETASTPRPSTDGQGLAQTVSLPPASPAEEQTTTVAQTPTPAGSLTAGRLFGKYELLEEIKKGGMGVVYRARHTLLDQVVALKMIRAGVLAGDEEVERFYREARAMARLDHAHIIRIQEIDQCEGRHYFTMPLAAGNLAEHLDRYAGKPHEAVALVEKIARAVQYAHEQGVLHRDLKPANVLLTPQDEPWVSDFGLAKFLDANTELSQSGPLLGTPAYMAPEQAAGQSSKISTRTDVWALGVLLYELLTGQRPFVGRGRDEISYHILHVEPPRLRRVLPGLDPVLEAIILKCLEKDPSQRYESAGALADDLSSWRQGKPTVVRPPSWAVRVGRGVRRHLRVVAAVVLLLAVGAAAALLLPKDKDKEEPTPPAPPAVPTEADLQAIRAALADGKAVTLVDKTGMPRWYRVRVGDKDEMILSAKDGEPLSLKTWNRALVELLELPDPLGAGYLIRAEVLHENNDSALNVSPTAGLCLAHSERETPKGRENYSCLLAFNDHTHPAGRADLGLHRYSGHQLNPQGSFAFVKGVEFPPSYGRTWRPLKVTVTPDKISAYWGEKEEFVGAVDPRELGEKAKLGLGLGLRVDKLPPGFPRDALKDDPNAPPPEFRLLLGLYVCHGAASFRNVVIEPLRENK